MRDRVYLLGGLRSHIGIRYGIFKMVRPEVLGGEILHRVWSKYGKSALPDLVLCGNAVGPGGNIGRLTVLEAGLPEEVPAMTLDLQCASALAAIDLSAAKIASGMADFILAGGTESASLAPRRIYQEWDERSRKRAPEFTAAQFRPGNLVMMRCFWVRSARRRKQGFPKKKRTRQPFLATSGRAA